MKGLIFREFLGMVEKEYGYETVDKIIENSDLQSKGIYTTVGTYPHTEMFALIGELSKEKNIPVETLLHAFGKFVFQVFEKKYKIFFANKTNAFQLLSEIENTIHVEVLKLYPEAELPHFEMKIENKDEMKMVYTSQRRMSDFAEGLIQGCLDFFDEKAEIQKEYLKKDGTKVSFRIKRTHE